MSIRQVDIEEKKEWEREMELERLEEIWVRIPLQRELYDVLCKEAQKNKHSVQTTAKRILEIELRTHAKLHK